MKPAEATLIVLGALQLLLLLRILALLRQSRAESPRTPDSEALARGLEGPFKRLAADWEAEHKRLAQQTEQAADLVARLTRLQFQANLTGQEHDSAAEAVDQPASNARQEARRRLLAGESVDAVAEATGLPDGEVRVLASVLRHGAG